MILVCQRPLGKVDYAIADEELGEEVLEGTGLQFNTLYYYKMDGPNDASPVKGSIPLANLTNLQVKLDEKHWIITLIEGQKQRKLIFDKRATFDTWEEALLLARQTVAEKKKFEEQNVKDISRLVRVYDKNSDKLEQEINEKFIVPLGRNWEHADKLLELCSELQKELLQVIEACVSSEPAR